jgi:hypothetical protein
MLLGLVLALNLVSLGSEQVALYGLVILIIGLFATGLEIGTGPSLLKGYLLYRRYRTRDTTVTRGRTVPDPRPREAEAQENQSSVEELEEDLQTREERRKEDFD